MDRPDASRVREISQVDFDGRGFPTPEGTDSDPLQLYVDRACAYVEFITARPLDATCPAMLEPIAEQAVQMRTEQIMFQTSDDSAETAGDFDLIASFGAGTYNETRRDATTAQGQVKPLNPWPALNDLLWMLLTLVPGEANAVVEARADYWRGLAGPVPPAWEIIEVDWSGGLGLSSGRLPGWMAPGGGLP
jgi:hypothetical protein